MITTVVREASVAKNILKVVYMLYLLQRWYAHPSPLVTEAGACIAPRLFAARADVELGHIIFTVKS